VSPGLSAMLTTSRVARSGGVRDEGEKEAEEVLGVILRDTVLAG
jgi:hypothetical protein